MEKSNRSYEELHILGFCQRHRPGIRVGGEEGGGHRVDLIVGALRAQDHRAEKLKAARRMYERSFVRPKRKEYFGDFRYPPPIFRFWRFHYEVSLLAQYPMSENYE
jgi:hypothetical protein